jgi:lipopolysaccharide export system permease protein
LRKINLFVSKYFLLYFFIVFIALETFFIGIDFILNNNRIPDSANISVIYLLNSFFYSISITVPISLIFAYIIFWLRLLKHSELIAIYSIGFNKKDILNPIIILSTIISVLSILLNFTNIAYSKDNMRNILENRYFTDLKSNIFVKNGDNYIFIKKLYRVEKKLENITIFDYQNSKLKQIIKAKNAIFINNIWRVNNATIYIPPNNMDIEKDNKLSIKILSEIDILQGFKPTILDNISEEKISLSITDAINTMVLLNKENISTNKIRGVLYSLLVFPIFAPFLIIILFYFSPISARLSNSIKQSSIFIFISLCIWGLFYSLTKFSSTNTVNPEFGAIVPVLILAITSAFYYKKL